VDNSVDELGVPGPSAEIDGRSRSLLGFGSSIARIMKIKELRDPSRESG
jgi:hypothetical protein